MRIPIEKSPQLPNVAIYEPYRGVQGPGRPTLPEMQLGARNHHPTVISAGLRPQPAAHLSMPLSFAIGLEAQPGVRASSVDLGRFW